jgi:hypothetical protein
MGDSVSALIYLLVATVINIVLDIYFVAGLGMEVAGVALATVIAQAVSSALCLIKLSRMGAHFDFGLKYMAPKGQYVGTYLYWGVNNNGWWGEGEIKFYMDDDKDFPTICGTGTEDYFCGSWNFDVNGHYTEFCTPYVGLAKVQRPDGLYQANQRFSMYRWHIPDPIYFEKNLRVTIQALGWRSGGRYLPLKDDISSVAFWYQDKPAAKFPKFPTADELEII